MSPYVELCGTDAATGRAWRSMAHWWDAGDLAAELAARLVATGGMRCCRIDLAAALDYAERYRERAFNRHIERVFELDAALAGAGPHIELCLRAAAD
ncbi:MAG: hypothetical protein JNJ60_02130 [Rhodocyclaceae bacterium]|nr:hypothetical protein [Rhodocyclaceae bacterium]